MPYHLATPDLIPVAIALILAGVTLLGWPVALVAVAGALGWALTR